MWGTDATAAVTLVEGATTIFAAIDHWTAECVGIHAARHGDRFEALEPLRQGVRDHFGAITAAAAHGLALRHDHGSVYLSRVFQDEIPFLGMTSSPAFVRQPEGNSCIERFFRTLKEQLLWVRHFSTFEELRQALLAFKETYNREWLIEDSAIVRQRKSVRRLPPGPRPDYHQPAVQFSCAGTSALWNLAGG